jgi:hypothetical protein
MRSPVEKRKEAGKKREKQQQYTIFFLSVGAVCQGEHLSIMV